MSIPDLLPPMICPDFTSWHLTGTEFVGAYLTDDGRSFEVLYFGHETPTKDGFLITIATYELAERETAVRHARRVWTSLHASNQVPS